MLGSLKRKRKSCKPQPNPRSGAKGRDADESAANSNGDDASANSSLDTPEANAARNVVC
jgi:hypothetical protein